MPFLRIRTRTSAGAASENLNEIWSARPSAFGEKASRVTATLPSVRVTASCVAEVATRPPVAFAASSILKMPSASGAGSKRSTCSPARFQAFGNAATSAPSTSTTRTATFAGVFSVYVIVVLSEIESPFGETVSGSTESPPIASEMSPPPIAPCAGRTL